MQKHINSVAVFCSATMGSVPGFETAAIKLGAYLAKNQIAISYGGAKGGLMGKVAETAFAAGGIVRGAMPARIEWIERANHNITEFVEVKDMGERKKVMLGPGWADACICLPGGFGTLDELFECATLTQLLFHEDGKYKPCGLLSLDNHFKYLLKHMDKMVEHGTLSHAAREIIVVDTDHVRLFKKMELLAEMKSK